MPKSRGRDTYHCLHCNNDFKSDSEAPTRCKSCGAYSFDTPPGRRNCPTGTNLNKFSSGKGRPTKYDKIEGGKL